MRKNNFPQRKSNRLKNFDYSSSGYYFVTICAKNRKEYFGNVVNKKMALNTFGELAKKTWIDLPNHYPSCLLEEFIIMPNHVHGIVIIKNVGAKFISPVIKGDLKIAPTKSKSSLSQIIKLFKSISTIEIRRLNHLFQWQKSFYDHIIRNEHSLHEIRQYIRYNPLKWEEDKNNPENLFM